MGSRRRERKTKQTVHKTLLTQLKQREEKLDGTKLEVEVNGA